MVNNQFKIWCYEKREKLYVRSMILRKQLISSSSAHQLVMQKDTHVPISCVMSVNHDLYWEFKRAFVDNSLLILIYRWAFTWLPIMSSKSRPSPVTSLLHQDFSKSGLKGKKTKTKTKNGWLRPWMKSPYANDLSAVFFKFGHRKVKENPSALYNRKNS